MIMAICFRIRPLGKGSRILQKKANDVTGHLAQVHLKIVIARQPRAFMEMATC